METLVKRWSLLALAALPVLAACGGGGGGGSAPQAEDDGAWMDTALVQVARDTARGVETVTLVNEAAGKSELVNEEALDGDAVEFEDPVLE